MGTRRTKSSMIIDFNLDDKSRTLREEEGKITSAKNLAGNTILIWLESGAEVTRFHETNIVVVKHFVKRELPFGEIHRKLTQHERFTLSSGGWKTPTTKNRINNFLEQKNLHVFTKDNVWYINERGVYDAKGSIVFYDGITFVDNVIVNCSSSYKRGDKLVRDTVAMKKRIAKYLKLITKDNLPLPSNGDCWICLMRNKDGVTMGDFSGNNNDHLLGHLKEGYVHGSILVNAMREKGYRDEGVGLHFHTKGDWAVSTFRRAVRSYLYKRLLPR